jgi:hypothetical protein
MISEYEFISYYCRTPKLKKTLLYAVNDAVRTVDFSKNGRYSINPKNKGVYYTSNNQSSWSWINSINTNYSCLYLILKHIVSKYGRDVGYLDFEPNFIDGTLDFLKSKIIEDKQTIFTPGSVVFGEMFFMAQKTWNNGLISEISSILTLKKYFEIGNVSVNFKRGDLNDMNKGTDLQLMFEGKYRNTQHKSNKLIEEGDEYTSSRLIYTEHTYRNNVDLFTIDSDGKIYLFRNSKDLTLCGTKNGKFFINKKLEIKQMKKEEQEFTNLLTDMTRICYEKKYIFNFEKGESGENYFEDNNKGSIREINFYLNDVNDLNLINIVKEQISKL